MGTIRSTIELTGLQKAKALIAMIDTGATRNYLPTNFRDGEMVEDIGLVEFRGKGRVIMANQTEAEGMFVRFIRLKILDEVVENPEFVILDGLKEDAIIGVLLLQSLNAFIDMEKETLEFRKNKL